MDYTKILLRPLTSEKTAAVKEASNQVVFFVSPDANKIEIAQAVEAAFKVKVTGVNIVKRRVLARKRHGKAAGRISGHKKAYVTLEAGHKIEFFEGV